jgi:hypothetical protein
MSCDHQRPRAPRTEFGTRDMHSCVVQVHSSCHCDSCLSPRHPPASQTHSHELPITGRAPAPTLRPHSRPTLPNQTDIPIMDRPTQHIQHAQPARRATTTPRRRISRRTTRTHRSKTTSYSPRDPHPKKRCLASHRLPLLRHATPTRTPHILRTTRAINIGRRSARRRPRELSFRRRLQRPLVSTLQLPPGRRPCSETELRRHVSADRHAGPEPIQQAQRGGEPRDAAKRNIRHVPALERDIWTHGGAGCESG